LFGAVPKFLLSFQVEGKVGVSHFLLVWLGFFDYMGPVHVAQLFLVATCWVAFFMDF